MLAAISLGNGVVDLGVDLLAGMLDIDPATGAVVDSNGNFVLGTSATEGKLDSAQPGSNKIMIAVNPVQASTAKVEKEISGRTLTIESSEQTKEANVSFTFTLPP